MYQTFFGLQRAPFQLTPDPEFLHLTEQHREALAGLTYAMLARRGFVVLTGNAGTGKTTLLRRVLQHVPAEKLQSSVIVNPTLSAAEFLEAAMLDFAEGVQETSRLACQIAWATPEEPRGKAAPAGKPLFAPSMAAEMLMVALLAKAVSPTTKQGWCQ